MSWKLCIFCIFCLSCQCQTAYTLYKQENDTTEYDLNLKGLIHGNLTDYLQEAMFSFHLLYLRQAGRE